MIVKVDLYSNIRFLFSEGDSIISIRTRLGIARQTVRKYCEGNTHPDVRKSYTRKSNVITKDVKSFIIDFFLHDEKEKIPKKKNQPKESMTNLKGKLIYMFYTPHL